MTISHSPHSSVFTYSSIFVRITSKRNYCSLSYTLSSICASPGVEPIVIASSMKMNTSMSHVNIALDQHWACISYNSTSMSQSEYRPFHIQWLDSSYQQTCLPDSPWQKVAIQEYWQWLIDSIRFSIDSNQRWSNALVSNFMILNVVRSWFNCWAASFNRNSFPLNLIAPHYWSVLVPWSEKKSRATRDLSIRSRHPFSPKNNETNSRMKRNLGCKCKHTRQQLKSEQVNLLLIR